MEAVARADAEHTRVEGSSRQAAEDKLDERVARIKAEELRRGVQSQ